MKPVRYRTPLKVILFLIMTFIAVCSAYGDGKLIWQNEASGWDAGKRVSTCSLPDPAEEGSNMVVRWEYSESQPWCLTDQRARLRLYQNKELVWELTATAEYSYESNHIWYAAFPLPETARGSYEAKAHLFPSPHCHSTDSASGVLIIPRL